MPIRVHAFAVILVLASAGLRSPQSSFAQEKSAQGSGFQSQVDLVSVYFTVRDDKKRLVSDLAQDSFNVTEDGQPQAIKFFAHHSDVVLNVGVLLDTGTRMSWILGEEAQASALFLKHVVRPTDLGFVVSYASRVEAVQLPTSDIGLLREATASIGSGRAAIGLGGIVTRSATEAVRNGVEQITTASIEALAHVPLSRRRGSPQREALL